MGDSSSGKQKTVFDWLAKQGEGKTTEQIAKALDLTMKQAGNAVTHMKGKNCISSTGTTPKIWSTTTNEYPIGKRGGSRISTKKRLGKKAARSSSDGDVQPLITDVIEVLNALESALDIARRTLPKLRGLKKLVTSPEEKLELDSLRIFKKRTLKFKDKFKSL